MANKENNKVVNIPYGVSHTKKYQPSVLASLLVERSFDDDSVTFISDVNLLLRQKTLQRRVGVDLLRDYVQSLERTQTEKHDFSDDELFQLIEPKAVNNITTFYEFAKYLQHNSETIKSKYVQMKKHKDTYEGLMSKLNNK